MKYGAYVVVVFLTIRIDIGSSLTNLTKLLLNEDALLNFTQLAHKYDHSAEEYDVTTQDGYVLKIFRIPGFKDRNIPQPGFPVLLMHGVFDSADTWILRGTDSLAITLANAGYNVWCGNSRGNRYSRKHINLNPDEDPAFWDFTFNELAIYDLTSLIDFVLTRTGSPKLNAIGHSQGTTIFFVLGSTLTEYNSKINVFIALAPVCYLQNVASPLSALIKLSPALYKKSRLLGIYELPGQIIGKAFMKLCAQPVIGYVKCILSLAFPITGYDSKQFEPSFLRTSLGHFPMDTSVKNLYHFGQVSRRRTFARFDYGPTKNLEVYGSEMPPNYDLSKVSMPVALLVGKNDLIAVVKDVALLRVQLPNVVRYAEIDYEYMNHIDFVWGRDMYDYLYPLIFGTLSKFN